MDWIVEYDAVPRSGLLLTRSQAVPLLGRRADSLIGYLGDKGALERFRLGAAYAYPLSSIEAYAKSRGIRLRMDLLPSDALRAETVREYPQDLISAAEASALLGLDPKAGYIRQLRRAKKIRGYWLLSQHGYSRAEVEAYAE